MRAHFGLPSVEAEDKEGKPPISVKFEIPYFTTSGIQVRKAQAAGPRAGTQAAGDTSTQPAWEGVSVSWNQDPAVLQASASASPQTGKGQAASAQP